MTMDRRQFTTAAAVGTGAMALLWQQACTEVADTGEVSVATAQILLDHQGPRGIYEDAEELDRLRAAIANVITVQRELRDFPLDPGEPPVTVFWRG